MKELECGCCGRTFRTEYYSDGYIDHCTNFSDKFNDYVNMSAEFVFKEICFNGNIRRRETAAKERLNCFVFFCRRTGADKLADEVLNLCHEYFRYQRYLDGIHDMILDLVEHLSDNEREYIGLDHHSFRYKWIIDDEHRAMIDPFEPKTMQELHGIREGRTCETCTHCFPFFGSADGKLSYKCTVWRVSDSAATDIRLKNKSCNKYEGDYENGK